ncbi:MAG: hypothetical protein DRO96_01065 [Candidatus Aenigmatarchaeota archaeon]|nr:MAG: hypothetical protein DRO96_01065 [Candidatus Aenigmarchaeota archaeon]
MKTYLNALMEEQINRGISLKTFIPRPLKYPELERLAHHCETIIDDITTALRSYQKNLEERQVDDVRDLFRRYRECERKMSFVENYGITALYYQTDELGYLNSLIHKIHQEINLPVSPPCVGCVSADYYFYHPFTNVIFVPLGEAEFLLHIPDAFHEIGHVILPKLDETCLNGCNQAVNTILGKLAKHYHDLLIQKQRENALQPILMMIRHIYSQWKEGWIVEFFCDLFALYTVGPAFAWSHLHLVAKKSDNIYKFSPIIPLEHPSDEARMKMLIIGLELLGYTSEAQVIHQKWNQMPFTENVKPITEYQYAYPQTLMKDVAEQILQGLQQDNFSITTPARLASFNNDSIIKTLNDAWTTFWQNPAEFRDWEKQKILYFKEVLRINVGV